MNEIERTEHLITEALRADGGWLDQRQIRKATDLPMSRVVSFTLSMALDGKIQRRLADHDHIQQFRVPAPAKIGVPYARTDPDTGARTCPECGLVIPETYDRHGEQTSSNYASHYQREHEGAR